MIFSLKPILVATLAALFVGGCINPMTTRLPQLAPRDRQTELKSFARHDPFPDPDLGPDTYARPRGFETERTQPRRNYEERLLKGQQPEFGPPGQPLPSTGSRYPNVVH